MGSSRFRLILISYLPCILDSYKVLSRWNKCDEPAVGSPNNLANDPKKDTQ